MLVIQYFTSVSPTPNIWTVFGLLSFIFLLYAFLSGDLANLLSYELAALITSALFCFFCSTYNFSDYTVICNENHTHTEIVPIVTTVDGTKFGESIYGDGFVIGCYFNEKSNLRVYQYYFKDEIGNIESNEISQKRTQITYLEENKTPYVEITYTAKCNGYRVQSQQHMIRNTYITYHFYIPKGSVQTNIERT